MVYPLSAPHDAVWLVAQPGQTTWGAFKNRRTTTARCHKEPASYTRSGRAFRCCVAQRYSFSLSIWCCADLNLRHKDKHRRLELLHTGMTFAKQRLRSGQHMLQDGSAAMLPRDLSLSNANPCRSVGWFGQPAQVAWTAHLKRKLITAQHRIHPRPARVSPCQLRRCLAPSGWSLLIDGCDSRRRRVPTSKQIAASEDLDYNSTLRRDRLDDGSSAPLQICRPHGESRALSLPAMNKSWCNLVCSDDLRPCIPITMNDTHSPGLRKGRWRKEGEEERGRKEGEEAG